MATQVDVPQFVPKSYKMPIKLQNGQMLDRTKVDGVFFQVTPLFDSPVDPGSVQWHEVPNQSDFTIMVTPLIVTPAGKPFGINIKVIVQLQFGESTLAQDQIFFNVKSNPALPAVIVPA